MRHTTIQGTAERTDRTHPRIFVAIMLEIQINKKKKTKQEEIYGLWLYLVRSSQL
jgi:hypothetical protein